MSERDVAEYLRYGHQLYEQMEQGIRANLDIRKVAARYLQLGRGGLGSYKPFDVTTAAAVYACTMSYTEIAIALIAGEGDRYAEAHERILLTHAGPKGPQEFYEDVEQVLLMQKPEGQLDGLEWISKLQLRLLRRDWRSSGTTAPVLRTWPAFVALEDIMLAVERRSPSAVAVAIEALEREFSDKPTVVGRYALHQAIYGPGGPMAGQGDANPFVTLLPLTVANLAKLLPPEPRGVFYRSDLLPEDEQRRVRFSGVIERGRAPVRLRDGRVAELVFERLACGHVRAAPEGEEPVSRRACPLCAAAARLPRDG